MNKFEKVSFEQYENAGYSYYGVDTASQDLSVILIDEYENIKLPKRATTGSAGYDFFAPFDFELAVGETIKIPTGIRVLLDNDKFLAIYPRSGLGFKYRLQLDNSIGVIDCDYSQSANEGHIFIKMTNDGREGKTISIKKREAFAQGIITQYFKTVDDETDGIRNGGFGSTNTK